MPPLLRQDAVEMIESMLFGHSRIDFVIASLGVPVLTQRGRAVVNGAAKRRLRKFSGLILAERGRTCSRALPGGDHCVVTDNISGRIGAF